MKPGNNPCLRTLLLAGVYALGIFGILASDSSGVGGGGLLCSIEVQAIAPANDGSGDIWVGLSAETENGTVDRVSRLGSSGIEKIAVDIATDNSENSIRTIAIATDGVNADDVYVGGDFSEGILRLNPDGTLDANFAVGAGFDGRVNSITPIPNSNGSIYVGGNFTRFQDIPAGGLVRLNAFGIRDLGFIAVVSNIETTVMESDISTNVYAGGTGFPPFDRWDSSGSPDETPSFFNNSLLGINPVFVMLPTLDGTNKIYLGGGFTSPNRIIRLTQNGIPDGPLLFDVGTGFDDIVTSIVRAEDNPLGNDIYVGGDFTTYDGAAANGIVRLTDNGSPAGSFSSGAGFSDPTDLSPQSQVTSLARATDGSSDLYVGGGFTRYDGRTVNGLVRLNENGSLDTGFEIRIVVDGLTCDNDNVRR